MTFHSYSPRSPVVFENFKAYNNNEFGIAGDGFGDVVFKNTKLSDNQIGIGYMKVNSAEMIAQIDTALIVGHTLGNSQTTLWRQWGISTAQDERQLINNVKFYNFKGSSAAFDTCHRCTEYSEHDQDARTIRV